MWPKTSKTGNSRRWCLLPCFSLTVLGVLAPPGTEFSQAAAQPRSAPEMGVWIDHTGQGAVEIAPCGSRLCGHIVWLKQPTAENGKPLSDIHNPEPAKRKRPICGLPVLGDLQRQEEGGWDSGWVYDPKTGKRYDLAIATSGRNQLSVTGYMGSKIFSETMTWTRAPANLPTCKSQTAAQKPGEESTKKEKSVPSATVARAVTLPDIEADPPRGVGGPLPPPATPPLSPKKTPQTTKTAPHAPLPKNASPAPPGSVAKGPGPSGAPGSRQPPAEKYGYGETPVLLSGPVPARRTPRAVAPD